jgi:hypothetical protein
VKTNEKCGATAWNEGNANRGILTRGPTRVEQASPISSQVISISLWPLVSDIVGDREGQ